MAMLVDKYWFGLWKDWTFQLEYDVAGYFNPHPEIHISILGLHFMFRLPWKNMKWSDECDPPSYGITIFKSMLMIDYGGKGNWGGNNHIGWELPFFSGVHMNRKWMVETADGMVPVEDIEAEMIKSTDKYVYYQESDKILKRTYDYTDKYDGEVIKATYWLEHREWRRKWLTWLPIFVNRSDYIEIVFDKEVGRGKGSWKGGTIGCSYELKKGETPEECIKRMEKERDL